MQYGSQVEHGYQEWPSLCPTYRLHLQSPLPVLSALFGYEPVGEICPSLVLEAPLPQK